MLAGEEEPPMPTKDARYREAESRLWASLGASPTERRVHLDRTGVTVRVQEVGAGPPILFVHGASNSGTSWAPLASRLPDFRCVLLDRPGCGLSDRLDGTLDLATFPTFAEEVLVDVLDALELPTASLVATSFGGYPALRTAASAPDRVDRMVLLGWTLGASTAPVPAVMRLANVPGLGALFASMPVSEGTVRSMFRRIGLRQALEAGRIGPEVTGWYARLLNDTDTMRAELAQGPRIISPLGGMDERVLLPDDVLGAIRTPTYLLWGEEDPFGDADDARAFAARIPTAELEVLPGAGHAVWLDDPDHVAGAVRAFLSR